MKKVVVRTEVYLDEVTNAKGYVMKGNKGDYIIARDTDGDYIWVRLTPSKTTAKAVKAYGSLKEAIKDKLDKGYKVFEYAEVEVQ